MAAFEDTFTEASTTLLTAHTPDVGTAWTLESGDNSSMTVVGGVGVLNMTSTTLTFVSSDDLGNADCWVEAELTDFGDFQSQPNRYVALRVQDSSNFIGWYLGGTGGGGMRLAKVVGGVITNLITMQGVTGRVYRVEAEGTTIRFYENGIQQGSDITVTDFQTETKQGIISSNGAAFLHFISTYNADTFGGGGITATLSEQGPGFTESINSTLTAAISAAITESGPSFSESIALTLTAKLNVSITESGPSFTEAINATVTSSSGITVAITETGPSFTESISSTLLKNINAAITEQGPSFTENISVSLIQDVTVNITETGPSFIESIIASLPVVITVNPRNIIHAKRQSTTVRVKKTSNSVRIKRKSNTIRVK